MEEDYGAQIRALADEVVGLTGDTTFVGVEHRGPGVPDLYVFADATFTSGPEALGHMREIRRAVQRWQGKGGVNHGNPDM